MPTPSPAQAFHAANRTVNLLMTCLRNELKDRHRQALASPWDPAHAERLGQVGKHLKATLMVLADMGDSEVEHLIEELLSPR